MSETNIFSVDNEEDKEQIRSLRIEFNSVLESCIAGGYIKKDEKKIYLAPEGKKFASFGGLCKAYGKEMSEFIKDWRYVVGTLALFAGAIKWEWFLAKALAFIKL